MKELVLKLVGLANEFKGSQIHSMNELVDKTGYHAVSNKISERDFYEVLQSNGAYVRDWVEYSEDKRTTDGWYIKKSSGGNYLVGCIGSAGVEEYEYKNGIEACAKFIKCELDVISRVL